MNKKLKKLSKTLKLNEDQIIKIIYYNHALEKLFKKNEVKEIEVNFELESMKYVKKIAKALKVCNDAVINAALQNYLDSKKENK